MSKKKYFVKISGESSAYGVYDLTQEEYKLINTIFNDLCSEYVCGTILPYPDEEELKKIGEDYIKSGLTFYDYYTTIYSNGWDIRMSSIQAELEKLGFNKISKNKKTMSDKNYKKIDKKLLAKSYLQWLYEFGTREEKEDIISDGEDLFILCSDKEYDYGGLNLKKLGYTPEEIEQNLIKRDYYKNKSIKHYIDWFIEKYGGKGN